MAGREPSQYWICIFWCWFAASLPQWYHTTLTWPCSWPGAIMGPRSLFIFPENQTKSLSWLVALIPRKRGKIPHWLSETGSKEGMKSGPCQVEPWCDSKGSKIHDLSWRAELPITESCLCVLFWLPRLKSTSWVFFFLSQPDFRQTCCWAKSSHAL